jgi:ligand-binding SRPBCC domain-containing protein
MVLHFTIDVSRPLKEVFQFASNLNNLPKVQPGFVKILKGSGSHKKGGKFLLLFWQSLFPTLWYGKISDFQENRSFTDIQIFGPFKKWTHTHTFQAISGGTRLEDYVEYELWGGFLGRWLDRTYIHPLLEKMYAHRMKRALEILGAPV